MRLLVGLGNPGAAYKKTRHNIGFQVLDEAAKQLSLTLKAKTFEGGAKVLWGQGVWPKLSGEPASPELQRGEPVILCEPQTYMNESGRAVSQVLQYYRLALSDLCVVHDDLDLDWGRLKLDYKAGSAGQKGVQSIIDHLGSKDFYRIRVGIGRPKEKRMECAAFVLGRYSAEEEKELRFIKARALEGIELLYREGPDRARSQFHQPFDAKI